MFNDNTAIALCSVTLLLFFVGGITGLLNNPYYLGFVVIIYLLIIVNIFINKQPEVKENETIENDV
ncbi:hypothetical protein [Olleya aquimaris]|uniref:Uncharacterized protein n=1 Tax=Olleya aquimaris TaxID=639310 RepID=A0A327RJ47_9FLAO|nr:hypothetical protein [Olleya aquimaris]RAJ16929.1 hypothetical protein LY08_00706 [Olleya aquimaris]